MGNLENNNGEMPKNYFQSEEEKAKLEKEKQVKLDELYGRQLLERDMQEQILEKRRQEIERKKKEKEEMEKKLLNDKINDKYSKIKNDLPVPFILDESKLTKLKNSKHENCSICLDDFEVGKQCLYLPCMHLFHSKCIVHWLLNNNECPVCKTSYKSEIQENKRLLTTFNQQLSNVQNMLSNLNLNNNNYYSYNSNSDYDNSSSSEHHRRGN